MPAVGDLDRGRRARGGRRRRRRRPGPGRSPRCPGARVSQRASVSASRSRSRSTGSPVSVLTRMRAVVPAAAEREVIDAEYRHGPRVCGSASAMTSRSMLDRPAGRPSARGQPRPGPAGQGQPDRGEHPRQQRGPPGPPRGQPLDLLGERDRGAGRFAAEEPAHRQPDRHRLPADRRISQPALVAAMHPLRELPHRGHARPVSAGPRPDRTRPAGHPGSLHGDRGQVRQEDEPG